MTLHGEWVMIIPDHLLHNDEKELAICQRLDEKWIVLSNKKNPRVVGVYDSMQEAYDEWSHS
jgi:hypothetical protein